MKKVICLGFVFLLIFGLCACSGTNTANPNSNNATISNEESSKSTPATITDNEGNTVQMTAKELIEVCGNQAKFDKLYRGASIKFTGTVKKVSTSTAYNSNSFYDIIFFEEGWIVFLPESFYYDKYADILAQINIGDKVYIESDISFCSTSLKEVHIQGMCDDNIGFDDDSMLSTVIRIVN